MDVLEKVTYTKKVPRTKCCSQLKIAAVESQRNILYLTQESWYVEGRLRNIEVDAKYTLIAAKET